MKTWIVALLASVTALAAEANPIVAANSTYALFLADEAPSPDFIANVVNVSGVFDGIDQSFTRNGQDYILRESQSDLGGGRYLIHVELSSDRDMSHAVAGGAGGLYLGLGGGNEPLDLLRSVYLDQAIVTFDTPVDSWINDHLADDYRSQFFSGAWSGRFLSANTVLVFPGAESVDIRSMKMDFYVSALPEPGSLALVTLALLGAGGVARQRRR